MKKQKTSRAAFFMTGIALAFAVENSQAAATVDVTFGDTIYTIDSMAASYDTQSTTFTFSAQPWWGDTTTADFFAQAVGGQLGFPNFNNFTPYLPTSVDTNTNTVYATLYPYDKNGAATSNTTSFTTSAVYWMLYVASTAPVPPAIVDMAEFQGTLANVGGSTFVAGPNMLNLSFEGAHHRTLLDNGLAVSVGKGFGVWATADAARYKFPDSSTSLSGDSRTSLGEIGFYKDFTPDAGVIRAGLGVGELRNKQSLTLDGKVKNDGQYVIGEVDHVFSPYLQGSVTAYYGSFDTNITRTYTTSYGRDTSTGKTKTKVNAVRLRADFTSSRPAGGIGFTPYLVYTWSRTKVDAYTETGGAFPVSYNSGSKDNSTFRAGLDMKKDLGSANRLIVNAQLVHSTDGSTPTISGSISGVGAYSVSGADVPSTWGRLTADIDHRFSDKSVATVGINASSRGLDPSYGVTVSYRRAF